MIKLDGLKGWGISSAHFTRAILVLLAFSTTLLAQTNSETLLFRASAYGTYAFVGQTIKSGKTAPVGIGGGCGTAQVGASRTGTVLTVNAPPIVTTGVINTSASSSATAATATADVHQVNLLAGLITADEVKAVSTTSENGTILSSSAAGSNFINLVIAGNSISSTPPPNTVINFPFGHVVLNEQILTTKAGLAGLTVNMIHVYITASNPLNLPANTQIIVADANSGLTQAGGPAVVDGTAYGTRVNVGNIIRSTPTAPVSVPCLGTNGKVITNSILSVNLSPLATSGTVTDTAEGNVMATAAQSQTTSTVQALNLLNKTVAADVIHAVASASTNDGVFFQFSDNGSSFTNLTVAGHPEINASVAANTQVNLAGLGTLYLHRVITTKNYIEVRMIELVITQQNVLGIPIGTDIRVADASASLHSKTKP